MKYILYSILIVLFLSCNKIRNEGDRIILNHNQAIADNRLIYISTQFISDVNCQNFIHEMYIDKIAPDYYHLTLMDVVRDKRNLNNSNSLNFIKINGQLIYLYSGIEDFFHTSQVFENNADVIYCNNRIWSVIIRGDSVKIYKDNVGIPFLQRDDDVIDGIDTTRWIYLP
ncbi:MAG: hypothetical protein QM786_17965 [Breznakibacter sp.]